MRRKPQTRMGLPLFIAVAVGGILYLLSFTLTVAPLFDDAASSVASDVTNVGYPP
jgi:hypothetical protein